MKKFFIIGFIMAAFIYRPVLSQEEVSKESSSKIKHFIFEKGKFVIKDFISLGAIKGSSGNSMEFFALVAYEPGREPERLRGLKIAITNDGTDRQIGNAYLDYDEVDNFNKTVVNMIQTASSWKYSTKDSSEATFSSRDNFRFGFFQRGMEQVCFAECLGNVKLFSLFDIEDIKTVKLILDKAKTILSTK